MRRESQPRRDAIVLADVIVRGAIWVTNRELSARHDPVVAGNRANVPSRETDWVTIVLALSTVRGSIQVAVEVHLFARVVLVNIFAETHDVVYAVLYAVDATSNWMLSNAHGIAETPSQGLALRGVIVRSRFMERIQIKCLDLRSACRNVCCAWIIVGATASTHEQRVLDMCGQIQCPCLMVRILHASYNGLAV